MKYTLTLLDTIGIQRYIFASNRLRENIGASELVERSIKRWAYELLPSPNNVKDPVTGELDPNLFIDRDNLAAEVIYAGGGNTAILFSSREEAKGFVQKLSLKILTEAPGLQFAAVHLSIDYSKDPLAEKVRKALKKLGKVKRNRPVSIPALGLSVTAECQSTGLPAAGMDPWPMKGEPDRLVSSEVAAKVLAAKEANERLQRELIPSDLKDKYAIPHDFDDLARVRGESSYLAVVHADGNSMGQRVKKLAERFQEPGQNRDYINAMRKFSEFIGKASKEALQACIRFIDQHVDRDPKDPSRYILADSLVLEQRGDDRRPYLPFRPLVFGGDDVTFVCNGQIGLALAVKYLETFEQRKLSDEENVYACAGITVVKLHYPFSRAYALSEELCQNAKKWVRAWTKNQDANLSALDWHFSTTGLSGDLEFIRKCEYTVRDGDLYLRPLRLHEDPSDPRSWPVVKELLTQFSGEEWAERRNKVKRLREVLREGPEEVKKFVAAYGELPDCAAAGFPASALESGWADRRCIYFDAIEAMDYVLLLDKL